MRGRIDQVKQILELDQVLLDSARCVCVCVWVYGAVGGEGGSKV